MHADEVDIDVSLVRRLLAAQFPQWAGLPIEPVASAGTDNAIFRLGADMAVRLPRHPGATGQVEKERRWLPRLAPLLPLAIPVQLATGAPSDDYAWPWSVHRWLEGEPATVDLIADPRQAATDLGSIHHGLAAIDSTGAPPGSRGVPLAWRDELTREAIASLHGTLDTGAVTAAWEAALQAPRGRAHPSGSTATSTMGTC
jgi:aminoglycoside phosphotransferase (APT) family kinase protein